MPPASCPSPAAWSAARSIWCKLAASDETQSCFASRWLEYGYGRALGPEDECRRASVVHTFAASRYDVRQLLLALTQTDAFLYLPPR